MKADRLQMVLAAAAILVAVAGCETTPTQQGALMGGVLGAGAGAIIGNQVHHSAGTGALIGGLGGAAAGALIGEQTGNRGGVAPSPSAPPPEVVVQPPPVVVEQAPVVYVQPYPVVQGGVTILVDPEDYYYMDRGDYYHHHYMSKSDMLVRSVPAGHHLLRGRIDLRRVPQKHFRHARI